MSTLAQTLDLHSCNQNSRQKINSQYVIIWSRNEESYNFFKATKFILLNANKKIFIHTIAHAHGETESITNFCFGYENSQSVSVVL